MKKNPAYPDEFYTDINTYLDYEWLCPYCVAPTQPNDRSCPNCKKPLVIIKRTQEDRSAWIWRGIVLQLAVLMMLLSVWATSFTFLLKWRGIPSPAPYLPLYFGLPVDRPEQYTEIVLTQFPLWVFWSFTVATLISIALIFVLFFRIPHGNTIYMISGSLMLAWGLTVIIFNYNTYIMLAIGLAAFFIGAGQLFVTLNLWSDFTFKETRLRLKIDSGIKNHPSMYISGRRYADVSMWGLAIIHYRRAIGRKSDMAVYHLALAVAYANIRRYDLAEASLNSAEKLDPDAPEIWHLRKKLNARKKRVKKAG